MMTNLIIVTRSKCPFKAEPNEPSKVLTSDVNGKDSWKKEICQGPAMGSQNISVQDLLRKP